MTEESVQRVEEGPDEMKANAKRFCEVAKSENVAELRRQRAAAAKDPASAEFVEAIDARVAELGVWNADPMSKEFKTLLDENEKAGQASFSDSHDGQAAG